MVEKRGAVAIFCSASEIAPKYTDPAQQLGKLIAAQGFEMVYGGTDQGLMKIMADTVQGNGGRVVGVIIPHYNALARPNADEMEVMQTLGERKARIVERSTAVVGLAGGIGTLDEITEMMVLKRQGKHNNPIILLNTDGFYDGFKAQLERMHDEGFFAHTIESVIQFADSPQEVMDLILAGEPQSSAQ